jgi:hypothetical protein
MHKIKKLQGGGIPPFNQITTLSGNPAPLAYTVPASLDFANQFKNYSQGTMNDINRKQSYLSNPIQGIATPEQIKAQIDSFGKTSTTAGSNKIGNLGGFLKKSGAGLLSGTNVATGVIKSLTPQAEDKGSQIAGQAMNTIGDIASSFGPVGSIVGAGAKVLGTLFTSIGPNVKGNTSKELTDSSSSYGGLDKLDSKKFGLFGIGAGKRYAKKVAEREQQRIKSEGILKSAQTDQEAAVGSIQNLANRYNLNMSGGWQQNNGIRFGKSGTKVSYDLSFAHKVLNHLKEDTPEKFEKGGKVNIIPEGALHARKHNIDTPELDGKITKKGIPVIVEGENGIKQVAEIEKNEIIFTKEITEKLEELRDKYSDDESSSKEKDAIAIEAGKLLVQEILYNTQDNTGLLNEVE